MKKEEKIMKDFSYRNEDDKAYGLAGMIMALGSMDALDLVQSVSLDSDGPMVAFSDEYYHLLSPSLSPKSVWEMMRRNYYITSVMVLGNLMARSMVRDGRDIPDELLHRFRDVMQQEGAETLDLEPDETLSLYRHVLEHNIQIFHNPRLQPKVEALSRRVALLRRLSAADILTELERL